ncbi:MAG TPA: serine/threonine-protein kinase [Stenotrophomonas sp.]|jgi:serine/threonine-protein kinase
MDAARWRLLSPLLDELLELDGALRQTRLQQFQAHDAGLGEDLLRLLATGQDSELFMVEPLVGACEVPSCAGAKVGAYQLQRLLGEGGAGQVWLASHQSRLEVADVALKLLRPQVADPYLRGRFEREIAILARLAHPGIPRLRDAGSDEHGQLYLALDYAPGIPISDFCDEQALSLAQRLALFGQVCDAVAHAHAQAVVHRDLKPSNILVDEHHHVSLLDFGIARLLDDAEPRGEDLLGRAFTLHYASPEQLRGESEGVAADVYSLGVVLYELLAGCKPYRLRRQSDAEWEKAILRVDSPPPSEAVLRDAATSVCVRDRQRRAQQLRGDLDAIALKALQKSAGLRYPTVDELAADLRNYQANQPVAARDGAVGYRALRWLQRSHLWPSHPI